MSKIASVVKSEQGYIGLNHINGIVLEEARKELRWPQSVKTYKKMMYDPTIAAANNVIDIMLGRVNWKFVPPDKKNKKAVQAADFLNWCMNNMQDQTWSEFINEVGSYRIYGYHISEKVYGRVKEGKYEGSYHWRKLATRSQDTVYKWLFDNNGRELIGFEQSLTQLTNAAQGMPLKGVSGGVIPIPRNKFMLFRYGTRRSNPEGASLLNGAYIPWKFKSIIEEYEAVGVAKDLGGIPQLGIDVGWLSKAAEDPNSQEAAVIAQLERDAANLHAGSQTHIIMPIAYNQSGKPLFEFKIVGVEGGGKQYDTDDIIKRKQNEILMLYLADVLKLGNDGSGSFALSESKNDLLALAIEKHLKLIADVINNDLVPQTLIINGMFLDKEDMPKLTYSDLDEVDYDNFSKLIQRVASVSYLPRTPQVINEILEKSGFEYRVDPDAELDTSVFPAEMASQSGDGLKGAGDGASKNLSGKDNSSANVEN